MIESMITIAIIGIMTATVIPALARMVSENRQHRATLEVMLAARRARVEAMFAGYASALYYVMQAGGAVIVPVTGLTTRCNRGDNGDYDFLSPVTLPRGWQELVGSPPILMSRFDMGGLAIRTRLTFNDAEANTGFLCWEPRGECWYSTTPWNAGAANPETVMFFNRLNLGGNEVGTERQLIFPASCTARIR